MRIVFRADSSVEIGSGHIMRCLTLAKQFRENGAEVSFISREHPGHLCGIIESQGFAVDRLPFPTNQQNKQQGLYENWLAVDWEMDAKQSVQAVERLDEPVDWLIVDHYSIDLRWERAFRPFVKSLMVIDDLANRSHDCDVLLDQNFYTNKEERYKILVPNQCKMFLGPRYALLREEFVQARRNAKLRDGTVQRILVFFGGSDPHNLTLKAIDAINHTQNHNLHVDVVVGSNNPHQSEIQRACLANRIFHFHCQIDYMASLVIHADLAIGAGGTATWERCYLGLPTLTIITAENQLETTKALASTGAIKLLGDQTVELDRLTAGIEQMIANPDQLKEMSDICFRIMGEDDIHAIRHLLDELWG